MIYTQLRVYQAAYALLKYLYEICTHVRREYRYTLAEDVKRDLIEVLLAIYRANDQTTPEGRLRHIHEGLEALVGVRVRLRVLCDLHEISEGQYTTAAAFFSSVSKQLTMWGSYTTKALEETQEEPKEELQEECGHER